MDQKDIRSAMKGLDNIGSEILRLRQEIHELKKALDSQNDILGELTKTVLDWKELYRSIYELPKQSAQEIFAAIFEEQGDEAKDERNN